MRRTFSLLLWSVSMMFVLQNCRTKQKSRVHEFPTLSSSSHYTYEVLETIDGTGRRIGWGYTISADSVLFIRQQYIPCIPERKAFENAGDARKLAALAVFRIEKYNVMPTATIHDLDSLNIAYKTDTATIIRQLSVIRERDQKTRAHGDSAAFIQLIDSSNQSYVTALIDKYGWPGKSFVGAMGNNTVFLVIQHADISVQEKYLPQFEASVADSESRLCDLALMEDRVLMRQNKKQIYGSQIVRDEATGGWKFYPIEDEKNVNIRRAKAGLMPIEEYAKYFGIEYKPSGN